MVEVEMGGNLSYMVFHIKIHNCSIGNKNNQIKTNWVLHEKQHNLKDLLFMYCNKT